MLVKIISTILRNTYTDDDLVSRLAVMRRYYESVLYDETLSKGATEYSIQEVLPDLPDDGTRAAVTEWRNEFIKSGIQPLVVYETLDGVEEEITGLPGVTLYLPIRFTDEHINRFGEWFRTNIQPNIMLNIRVDPATAGGCAFVWKNVYYDFSFKYFAEKKREEIVKLFDST